MQASAADHWCLMTIVRTFHTQNMHQPDFCSVLAKSHCYVCVRACVRAHMTQMVHSELQEEAETLAAA